MEQRLPGSEAYEEALYKDRRTVKARRIRKGVWEMQSRSRPDLFYTVDANVPECQCEYFDYHASCPHIVRVGELEKDFPMEGSASPEWIEQRRKAWGKSAIRE